jgi:hypothetical protein
LSDASTTTTCGKRDPMAGASGKDHVFVLDQGGKVSHFNYFSNLRTASAIVNALGAHRRSAGRIPRHRPLS